MRVDFVAQPAGRSAVTFTVDTDRTASGRGVKGIPIWTECLWVHCPAAVDLLRAHAEDRGRMNQRLARRVRLVGTGDAGGNGLIQLFSMGMCMSDELETRRGALRALVAAPACARGGA